MFQNYASDSDDDGNDDGFFIVEQERPPVERHQSIIDPIIVSLHDVFVDPPQEEQVAPLVISHHVPEPPQTIILAIIPPTSEERSPLLNGFTPAYLEMPTKRVGKCGLIFFHIALLCIPVGIGLLHLIFSNTSYSVQKWVVQVQTKTGWLNSKLWAYAFVYPIITVLVILVRQKKIFEDVVVKGRVVKWVGGVLHGLFFLRYVFISFVLANTTKYGTIDLALWVVISIGLVILYLVAWLAAPLFTKRGHSIDVFERRNFILSLLTTIAFFVVRYVGYFTDTQIPYFINIAVLSFLFFEYVALGLLEAGHLTLDYKRFGKKQFLKKWVILASLTYTLHILCVLIIDEIFLV